MSVRLLHPDEYELGDSRSSVDSEETFHLDEADFASYHLGKPYFLYGKKSLPSRILSSSSYVLRRVVCRSVSSQNRKCSLRVCPRRICFMLPVFLGFLLTLIVVTFIFRPSYTNLPEHYQELRNSMLESKDSGRGNPRDEKVFIAVSLYDKGGKLVRGQWGQALIDLIGLIGEDNVFLSIFENDNGEEGARALEELRSRISCKNSLVFEELMNTTGLPTVQLLDGSTRIKRVGYLAETRNRALRPLDDDPNTKYDKLLYLNDVLFDPMDAAQLLFSTNRGSDGITHYRSTCAVDFINPFKFYDTFATRDLQGYGIGLPFFPWFTTAGAGQSRRDVLDEKDAVRVRSCWGGMVAFDARFFQGFPQQHPTGSSFNTVDKRFMSTTDVPDPNHRGPVRFRAEDDLFWESSECCLIHADIQDTPTNIDDSTDSGVYMNPFIRTSYTPISFSWLWFTRRFERLYPWIHSFASHVGGFPRFNPRRTELAGASVEDKIWIPDSTIPGGGSFVTVMRTARDGRFCSQRGLMVLKFDRGEGEESWEEVLIPSE